MRGKECWLFLIIIILLSNCSSSKKLIKEKTTLTVPAGVDTSIAILVDSTAKTLFVSFEDEDEANKLKKNASQSLAISDSAEILIKILCDTSKRISDEHRQQAIERFNGAAKRIIRLQEIEIELNNAESNEQTIKDLKKMAFDLLLGAKNDLESSVKYNPFDLEARDALAWVLWRIATRFEEIEKYYELVDVLTILIHLDQGDHQLYFRLGRANYGIKNWEESLEYFEKAQTLLLNYQFLQETPDDSLNLYTYLYSQGDVFVELINADSALSRLKKAMNFVTDSTQQEDILGYIKWIEWDNGNILASKQKDKILNSYALDQNHEQAVQNFNYLLTLISKQEAIDEINWRIARIEFSELDLVEQGIKRLHQLVSKTKIDSLGCPVKPDYQIYFEDFAIMCNNIAIPSLRNRISRKIAYNYFLQVIKICSSIRGKLYVEIANLSKNNPKVCIAQSLRAFEYLDPNDMESIETLIKHLTNSYRKKNVRDSVQIWYNLWKNVQSKKWKELHFGINNALADSIRSCIKWSEFTYNTFKTELTINEGRIICQLLIDKYGALKKQEKIDIWRRELQFFIGVER